MRDTGCLRHSYVGLLEAIDSVLTFLLRTILYCVILIGIWCIYENAMILEHAGTDRSIQVYKPDPDTADEAGLDQLLLINPDIRGWITIPDTPIDHPILQGKDNVRYVNTDVYGDFSVSGSIFLDCRGAGDFADPYSLIYGHHMEGGRMFGSLDRFQDPAFLKEHTRAVLTAPGSSQELYIFACMNADGYDQRWYDPHYYDGTGLGQVIQEILKEAYPGGEAPVPVQAEEAGNIIALSTCASEGTNRRILVFAYCKDET